MNKAIRLMLCLSMLAGLSLCAWAQATPQSNDSEESRYRSLDFAKLPQLPPMQELPFQLAGKLTPNAFPMFQFGLIQPPFAFSSDTVTMLQGAIMKRLGIRYKYTGSDDRGYDCSGFVWRVFHDAGADFERVAARTLWRQLPEANHDEVRQFGTLVFFNGLKHIGIVRDAYTFYHSSRSQGVTVSQFSGYWEKRLTGFRRSPVPVEPLPPAPPAPSPAAE